MDCGLDYLRVTASDLELQLPDVLHSVRVAQDGQEDAGNKRLRFAAEGFEGETCGGWRWGKRDGLWLFEASSERSQQLLEVIKRTGLDCRGTRVDLHVTYARAAYDDLWAVAMLDLVRRAETEREVVRALRCEVIDNPRKGNTLYCYSRRSRRHLRDYDKSAEQRHKIPEGTFRSEAEYKKEMAREMFKRARNCLDTRFLALDVVTEEWKRLGIDKNWDWQGQPVDMRLEKRPADQIVTARWFIETACPAFHRLTDPSLIAECLERLLADPHTGAYKEFPARPEAPTAPLRKPRQVLAAEARKRVKEDLNVCPRGSHKAAAEWADGCNCDVCVARRAANEV